MTSNDFFNTQPWDDEKVLEKENVKKAFDTKHDLLYLYTDDDNNTMILLAPGIAASLEAEQRLRKHAKPKFSFQLLEEDDDLFQEVYC